MVAKGKKSQKKWKFIKHPMEWAITKVLPKVYYNMNYTPEELWKKFIEYVERSDKHNEEVVISGFWVFASLSSTFLTSHRDSLEFSEVVEAIYQVFEYRYEQKWAKWINIAYLMNNRFKWKRESTQNINETHNLHPDVKSVLDQIIYKKSPDGTK